MSTAETHYTTIQFLTFTFCSIRCCCCGSSSGGCGCSAYYYPTTCVIQFSIWLWWWFFFRIRVRPSVITLSSLSSSSTTSSHISFYDDDDEGRYGNGSSGYEDDMMSFVDGVGMRSQSSCSKSGGKSGSSSSSSFLGCGEGNGNGYYLSRLLLYLLLSTSLWWHDRVPHATCATHVARVASSAIMRGKTFERRFTVSHGGGGTVGVSCTAATTVASPAIAEVVDVINEVWVERQQQQQHAGEHDRKQHWKPCFFFFSLFCDRIMERLTNPSFFFNPPSSFLGSPHHHYHHFHCVLFFFSLQGKKYGSNLSSASIVSFFC